MEGDTNNNKIKTSTSSINRSKNKNSKGRSSKKVVASNLSNDELLEQIMNKKKGKSNKVKNSSNSKKIDKKVELSSDELFDQIMASKKKKKSGVTKKKNTTKSSKIKVNKNIDNVVLDDKEKVSTKEKVDLDLPKKIETKDNELVENKSVRKKNINNHKSIVDVTTVHNNLVKDILKKQSEEDLSNTVLNEIVLDVNNELSKDLNKSKSRKLNLIIIVLLLFISIMIFFVFDKLSNVMDIEKVDVNEYVDDFIYSDINVESYKQCLSNFDIDSINTNLSDEIEELNNYIADNYKASIYFEDIDSGFKYMLNENTLYYNASTFKIIPALYLYIEADKGNVDLSDLVVYKSKNKLSASEGMKNHKVGDKISLKTLVYYSLNYSDNSAHSMLVEYIGVKNINQFIKDIGGKYSITSNDYFGNNTVLSASVYINKLYEYLLTDTDNSKELKNIMINAEQNDINLEIMNISAVHKYGEYEQFYHDYGIVFDEHPYKVVIYTTEGYKKEHEEIIEDINFHLFMLHKKIYSEKEKTCLNEL